MCVHAHPFPQTSLLGANRTGYLIGCSDSFPQMTESSPNQSEERRKGRNGKRKDRTVKEFRKEIKSDK